MNCRIGIMVAISRGKIKSRIRIVEVNRVLNTARHRPSV